MRIVAVAVTFAILLSSLPALTHAQARQLPADQGAPQAAVDVAHEARIEALQSEVQTMKDFTQHILATVYWALGTVLVVLLAMIGFGWYQNFRVYERDKETLRQDLLAMLRRETAKGLEEVEESAAARFLSFDEKMATALERAFGRLADVELALEASIFRSAHTAKTPRTDFAIFCDRVEMGIGHVSPAVRQRALSVILDYVEGAQKIDGPTLAILLTIAQKVETEDATFGERLREILADKR